jgi:hypothetical protein
MGGSLLKLTPVRERVTGQANTQSDLAADCSPLVQVPETRPFDWEIYGHIKSLTNENYESKQVTLSPRIFRAESFHTIPTAEGGVSQFVGCQIPVLKVICSSRVVLSTFLRF